MHISRYNPSDRSTESEEYLSGMRKASERNHDGSVRNSANKSLDSIFFLSLIPLSLSFLILPFSFIIKPIPILFCRSHPRSILSFLIFLTYLFLFDHPNEMANQKMYLPPHRRPSSQPLPSTPFASQSPIPRESLLEGTILGLSHLHLHPLSPPTNKTLVESQSVRRGNGRFGAPSETTLARSITAVVSQTDHGETTSGRTEEDLDNVSALYSESTNLARSIITHTISTVDTDAEESSTRAHTPLPTREWTSVDIRAAPLPPKPLAQFPITPFLQGNDSRPRPLADRIGGYVGNPRPLVERIGGLYIPPGRQERERDDNSFWQSQAVSRNDNDRFRPRGPTRDNNDSINTRWQSEVIRRQRRNFNKQSPSQPGPSRRCLIPPSFTQIAVLFHSLGEKMTSIKLDDLEVREGEGIENVVYAGSYKWIESDDGPTLAVPGMSFHHDDG